MKKILTFVFVLSFVFYLSNVSTFAQSRGNGNGPAVTSGHAPDINHSTDHGKSGDHANTDHASAKNQGTGTLYTRISANDKLSARLTGLIPTDAAGQKITTLQDLANLPWKNQGQMIAFLHVANNQKLDPTEWMNMRNAMTGTAPVSPTGTAPVSPTSTGTAPLSTTSTDKLSVGQALHLVRPNLSETQVSVQVQQAETQTKEDLKIKPTS